MKLNRDCYVHFTDEEIKAHHDEISQLLINDRASIRIQNFKLLVWVFLAKHFCLLRISSCAPKPAPKGTLIKTEQQSVLYGPFLLGGFCRERF